MLKNRLLKRIALIGSIWLGATLSTGLVYAGFDWSLYQRTCRVAGLWYLNIVFIGLGISWLVSKVSFDQFPKAVFFGIHIVAALLGASIWTALAFLDLKIYPDPAITLYLNNMYPQYFNIGVFVYAAMAGWFYTLQFQRKSKEQAIRETDLKRLAREAELRALKAQINPHFLFNALNSVNALVVQHPQAAREINVQLANILRYALDSSETEYVTLQQELDFINYYLEIEKIRLNECLQVKISVDEKLLNIMIPPMTLEPLVENAIIHGLSERPEGGTLSIVVNEEDGKLQCQVSDTGRGFRPDDNAAISKRGIGLKNTLERLKRLYENKFTYSIQNNTPSGCTVTLSLPIEDMDK